MWHALSGFLESYATDGRQQRSNTNGLLKACGVLWAPLNCETKFSEKWLTHFGFGG